MEDKTICLGVWCGFPTLVATPSEIDSDSSEDNKSALELLFKFGWERAIREFLYFGVLLTLAFVFLDGTWTVCRVGYRYCCYPVLYFFPPPVCLREAFLFIFSVLLFKMN
ncbi:hypothetical protein QBC37DRAFT_57253 [Rhypophila decipiens]|uniref:Uncharacterized protein n=1 Tax=Rhypophila decipiens TaxID=261697 RepID=A0AAN6YFP4_9PEZI|nr:hypothetical protein QBC37DRAFT_57253 [Rhypophila decipiens]